MPPLTHSTGLTITNPLILYRALIATKQIEADPSQHRLAIHLQKLYHRLKDYEPEVEFSRRLKQIKSSIEKAPAFISTHNEPNPQTQKGSILTGWRGRQEDTNVTSLARRLTDQESAIRLQSPKGLLLYGEVGSGKSFLIDLLADCLPNKKKRRWHFNTFMLETFAKIEALRRESLKIQLPATPQSEEHSLLRLARDMISTSPILFLDEFQLPDRAASKILSNLLTSFFHLGGVMIATSNRMPEELANASGVEFAAPPSSRLGLLGKKWGLLGKGTERTGSEKTLTEKGDFAAFLEVLRARCEVWDMEGKKDWRRRETEEEKLEFEELSSEALKEHTEGFSGFQPMIPGNVGLGYEQSLHLSEGAERSNKAVTSAPKHYFLRSASSVDSQELANMENEWRHREVGALKLSGLTTSALNVAEPPWDTSSLRVYGRTLVVPRNKGGVTKWTFHELCGINLGPADYITLASSFHTFILTDVPILTLLQKNEARRFITLLDALYEARCKLLISAEAGPDHIFFPEDRTIPHEGNQPSNLFQSGGIEDNSVYSETLAEIYQDQTSPFRPNISSYLPSASPPNYASSSLPTSASQLSAARSILADEDSDFGPVYGAGRRSGASDGAPGAGNEIGRQVGPDFTRTGAYTGEDEKFAYKRATSRIWEMCSSRWWAREGDWWKPVSKDIRKWEWESLDDAAEGVKSAQSSDEAEFRHGASPFRTSKEAPPKFAWTHAWGMMTWGKKAGAWGKGPAGLSKRRKDGKSTDGSEDQERG